MDLKRLLKRGALITAANWQTVAIQFVAETTFQILLAVPILGAALMVAVLLGGDGASLFQSSIRETFTAVADALTAEPVALGAFVASFSIVLVGGSVLMFLVKGGTMAVLVEANEHAGPIELDPITYEGLKSASRFSMPAFLGGCTRFFRSYLKLGLALMLVYVITGVAYLALLVYGYRATGGEGLLIGWTFLAALAAVALVLWITLVNLAYLLLQMAMAVEGVELLDAIRLVIRFIRAQGRILGGVFAIVFLMVVGATFASALAWSGVGLIAFVPLVGLAVFPLQIAAWLVRGLVFEYLGLTALGAYLTLYRLDARTRSIDHGRSVGSAVASTS